MLLLTNLVLGGIMILMTIIIHALVYNWVLNGIPRIAAIFTKFFGRVWKTPLLTLVVSLVITAIFIDIWLWTFLLMALDSTHLHDIETGLYYASTSFTTVGYGDVILSKDWRILGTICAINGMFLFGWSAAFIYEIMDKLYHDDAIIKKRR
jgi:hypothetical protein